MKKLIALALSALMLLSLVACGNTPAETTPEVTEPEVTTPEAPETPEVPADNVIAPTVEDGTWGAAFWADFQSIVAANKGENSEVLANALLAAESGAVLMPMGGAMVMPFEPGFLQGFTQEVTGFKNCALIMANAPLYPFVAYVFEMEAGADVKAFVKSLNDTYDLRWQICVEAEMATIGAIDNYVLAVLSPVEAPVVEGGNTDTITPAFAEGSKAEALWNEFVSYMENFGSMSLAADVVDALSMGAAIGNVEPETEALDLMVTIDGFKYEIEGHNNAALLKAGEMSIYVFQIDAGMMPDSWGDWNLGSNIPEGTEAVWGAYGETLILMINTEA
ncbi:MAG: hypothetical protein E7606_05180 [Ruminococcaceae bacterium]|nr:hypothetical protein [Oscillospiraceae bacterium]